MLWPCVQVNKDQVDVRIGAARCGIPHSGRERGGSPAGQDGLALRIPIPVTRALEMSCLRAEFSRRWNGVMMVGPGSEELKQSGRAVLGGSSVPPACAGAQWRWRGVPPLAVAATSAVL